MPDPKAPADPHLGAHIRSEIHDPPAPPEFKPEPRAPGDYGTAHQAIDWALDRNALGVIEAGIFLRAWRGGELDEYPDYLAWLAVQPRPRRDWVRHGLDALIVACGLANIGALAAYVARAMPGWLS